MGSFMRLTLTHKVRVGKLFLCGWLAGLVNLVSAMGGKRTLVAEADKRFLPSWCLVQKPTRSDKLLRRFIEQRKDRDYWLNGDCRICSVLIK